MVETKPVLKGEWILDLHSLGGHEPNPTEYQSCTISAGFLGKIII